MISFQPGVRLSLDIENQFTAINRCLDLLKVKPEAPLVARTNMISSDANFRFLVRGKTSVELKRNSLCENNAWLTAGEIKFEQVNIIYKGGLNRSLMDFSLEIKAGTKLGIIGK